MTIAMRQMRAAQRGAAPKQTSARHVWAHLPLHQKQHLCMLAFGVSGIELADEDWSDLEAKQRALIGLRARTEAAALV